MFTRTSIRGDCLIVLHFCGVLSLSVFVVGFITAVVGSCAKLVAAVAKEVLNDN